ncbi:MAG: PD-(D/E)XK nuclease family protein [Paracoccaceae bacterium]
MSKKEVYLSASRIKTAQQCSWTYWCKYILKLPDRSNDGASKGWICHLIFELLGEPKRIDYYNKIVKEGTVWNIESIKRLIKYHAKKLCVIDQENMEDIDKMIVCGLRYDFFGEEGGSIEESFSEKDFALKVDEEGKRYNIRGFIDKLFLYKDKSAIIRDFKTSKQKFKGKEIDDNMQDLMYCLAIKKLYPEYKSISEFLFLKFALEKDIFGNPGNGVIKMSELSDDVLEGFEYELSGVQNYLENFSEENAKSNFASDQGYPKDGTFGGPLACGKDGFKICKGKPMLDKNGEPIKAFICAFRKPFEYFALIDKDGNVKKSVYTEDEHELLSIKQEGENIEKREYSGCPAWNASSSFEL